MSLPDTPQGFFTRAYSGGEARAGMKMFHHRLSWRADLLRGGAIFERALAEAHRRALEYMQEAITPGSLVLDIGCGSGLFLEATRRRGYRVAGLEVAEPAVAFLKEEGYRVFHGTVEEVPEAWASPALCTAFYVLHHVSDPVGFLSAIKRKFPNAHLVLTEHYFGNRPTKLTEVNLPPRRLTVWTPQALRFSLARAGYAVDLVDVAAHEPWHPWLDGRLTQFYCAARNVIPQKVRPHLIAAYFKAQHLLFSCLRAVVGNNSWTGQEHLLAIARPLEER